MYCRDTRAKRANTNKTMPLCKSMRSSWMRASRWLSFGIQQPIGLVTMGVPLVNGCYQRCPTRGFSELISISISELGQSIVEPAPKAR